MKRARSKRVLFIVHEESLTGAPLILLRIAKHVSSLEGFETLTVSRRGGSAHGRFMQDLGTINPAHILPDRPPFESAAAILAEWRPDLVYANSAETYAFCIAAKAMGIPAIFHLHELDDGFDHFLTSYGINTENDAHAFRTCAELFIVPCRETEDLLAERFGVDPRRIRRVPEFIDPDEVRSLAGPRIVGSARNFRVAGCGTATRRKGIDLFVQSAHRMPDVDFVWIGKTIPADMPADIPKNLSFAGEMSNPFPMLAESDLLLLTSREDPFPLVALESMALGLPVVAWRWGGGIHEAIRGCGTAVEDPEPASFERAIRAWINDSGARRRAGETARIRAKRLYSPRRHLSRIAQLIAQTIDRASA